MNSVETWVLNNMSIVVPFVQLFVSLLFKMMVDRSVTLAIFAESLLELPVEMKFLAIGFFASFAIAPQGEASLGFLLVIVFLLTSMITTLLARRAKNYLASSNHFICVSLTMLNFVISFLVLSYGIAKVKGMAA